MKTSSLLMRLPAATNQTKHAPIGSRPSNAKTYTVYICFGKAGVWRPTSRELFAHSRVRSSMAADVIHLRRPLVLAGGKARGAYEAGFSSAALFLTALGGRVRNERLATLPKLTAGTFVRV